MLMWCFMDGMDGMDGYIPGSTLVDWVGYCACSWPIFRSYRGKIREGEWSYLSVYLGCFWLLGSALVCSGCFLALVNYLKFLNDKPLSMFPSFPYCEWSN